MLRVRLRNLLLDLTDAVLRLEQASLHNKNHQPSKCFEPKVCCLPARLAFSEVSQYRPFPGTKWLKLTYHGKQPPASIARLRANTKPVLRARPVQLDVLVRPAVGIAWSRDFRNRIVSAFADCTVSDSSIMFSSMRRLSLHPLPSVRCAPVNPILPSSTPVMDNVKGGVYAYRALRAACCLLPS